MGADGKNKNNVIVFGLVTMLILIAGYAAITRYDRKVGPPEAPLGVAQPPPKAPADTQTVSTPSQDSQQARDALTQTVQALIDAERALPAPVTTSATGVAPTALSPMVINVVGDPNRPAAMANRSGATSAIDASLPSFPPNTTASSQKSGGEKYPIDQVSVDDAGTSTSVTQAPNNSLRTATYASGNRTPQKQQDAPTPIPTPTTEPVVAGVDTTVSTQAMSKVTEAEALLKVLNQPASLQPAASQTRLQQRMERISTLRSQLSELSNSSQ